MADSDSVLWGVEWGVLCDTEGCSMVVECTPRLAAAAAAAAAELEKGYPAPFMPSGYPGNPNGGRTVPVTIHLFTLEKYTCISYIRLALLNW